MAPTLLVQGFQRAFVDITGPTFSVSASMRRSTCEEVLKFARANGWTVIHVYLDSDATTEASAALDGFSPWPGEAYFRQKTLSPFRTPSLEAKLRGLSDGPIYLISLAGVGVIGATFFDALERGLPLQLISNAIADSGRTHLSERKGLAALADIALAFSRSARWPDLLDPTPACSLDLVRRQSRLALEQFESLNLRARDLTALLLLAQYLLDQAPPLATAPGTLTRLLEDVIGELEMELDRTGPPSTDFERDQEQHPRRFRN
ncbi:MAG: isochorismatase family protein [Burkholderiales bacterium]|nr:MAG: isochorismatase family protein [Burkholderiales bacterium]